MEAERGFYLTCVLSAWIFASDNQLGPKAACDFYEWTGHCFSSLRVSARVEFHFIEKNKVERGGGKGGEE